MAGKRPASGDQMGTTRMRPGRQAACRLTDYCGEADLANVLLTTALETWL